MVNSGLCCLVGRFDKEKGILFNSVCEVCKLWAEREFSPLASLALG
jgi:hypothetical protein